MTKREQQEYNQRDLVQSELIVFKGALENATDAIGMSTPQGRHYYQNKAFTELFGIIGADPPSTLYCDEKVGKEVFRIIMAGETWTGEVEMYAKDRRILNILLRAYAIKNEQGGVIGLVGIHTDITEQRRAEDALKLSEATYRSIFNSVNDTIWIHDIDSFKFIDVNNNVTDMFGYSVREALNLTVDDISSGVPPFTQETAVRRLLKKARTGESQVFEWHTKHKDGHLFWTEVSLKSGNIAGRDCLLAIERDITERKRSDEKLRKTLAEFQAFMDNLPSMVIIKDSELRPLYFNREFLKHFPGETWLGKTPHETFPVEVAEEMKKADLQAISAGSIRYEETWVDKAGVERTLETRKFAIKQEDSKPHLGAIIADITGIKLAQKEHQNLQEQLYQAQKMESIGRLAGGVAHDINNMLAVILGYSELAMNRLEPDNPLYADLKEVNKAANRSAGIVNKLLAFARKQIISPKTIDLNDTVATMVKMLRRLIGEDIDLTWKPGKDLILVNMDPTQIDQILVNLCINARDAIADVGKVAIETGTAVFDEANCVEHVDCIPGEFVRLTVSDDGHGMDQETLAQVFEPFFTTKSMDKGTGLGLATVYGIVKQNNGFIDVNSESDHGTTFNIYMPRHVGKKTRQSREESLSNRDVRGHETILLVEDDPSVLKIATIMLENVGYTLLTTSTPGEAVRLAREHVGQIHLLMTDVVMPEMNGRDLTQNLLSSYPNLKHLFMSGYTANVIAQHGVLERGVNFIQKPFLMKDLVVKIREILDKE